MNCFKNIRTLIEQEKSAHKIAAAAALGTYIAFSPFMGFHTVMVVVLSWFFKLNGPFVFAVNFLINNPWTMGPVYFADYIFGHWLCGNWCMQMLPNPFFIEYITQYAQQYVPLPHFNFWTFMIGGNLLALLLATVAYLFVKYTVTLMQKDYKITLADAA